jgi:hypothetical protein
MTRKVVLSIPDGNYRELASLSEFYKQDIKQTILEILESVGRNENFLKKMNKGYKVPAEPKWALDDVLNAGTDLIRSSNNVLELLQAEGLFTLNELSCDLDESSFDFSYEALKGSNLCVDQLFVTIEQGLKSLRAHSIIDAAKVGKKSIEKLEKLVEEIEQPKEFYDVEEYDIDIEPEEEYPSLIIRCDAESLGDFPNIKELSRFVERLFKKAGILKQTG